MNILEPGRSKRPHEASTTFIVGFIGGLIIGILMCWLVLERI